MPAITNGSSPIAIQPAPFFEIAMAQTPSRDDGHRRGGRA
jgi:hypothetical protein